MFGCALSAISALMRSLSCGAVLRSTSPPTVSTIQSPSHGLRIEFEIDRSHLPFDGVTPARDSVLAATPELRITLYRPSEEPIIVDPSITISFPARTEFVRVARLAATGVVSIADWTVDDVEDFRLAVSEACAHLAVAAGCSRNTHRRDHPARTRRRRVRVARTSTASPD